MKDHWQRHQNGGENDRGKKGVCTWDWSKAYAKKLVRVAGVDHRHWKRHHSREGRGMHGNGYGMTKW